MESFKEQNENSISDLKDSLMSLITDYTNKTGNEIDLITPIWLESNVSLGKTKLLRVDINFCK